MHDWASAPWWSGPLKLHVKPPGDDVTCSDLKPLPAVGPRAWKRQSGTVGSPSEGQDSIGNLQVSTSIQHLSTSKVS